LKSWTRSGAGEFLVLAATLMDIKFALLLLPKPAAGEPGGEDWLDPRADLVRQLLAYRAFPRRRRRAQPPGRAARATLSRAQHPRTGRRTGQVDIEDVRSGT
jgi:chromatin segregation and condensation protein Rec8/ScpA/Scc1 (kleisin family)